MRKITSDEGKRQTLFRYVSPLSVRIGRLSVAKLDSSRRAYETGPDRYKVSLKQWLEFSSQERIVLCHLPVEMEEEKQAFSAYVDFLSRRYNGQPVRTTVALSSSLWDTSNQV